MGDRCSPGGPGDQEAEATVRIVKESRAEERAERGNYQRIIETREGSKEIRKSREGRKKRFSRRVARLRPRGRPRSMSLPWRPGPAPWCSTTDYLCQRFLPLSSPSPLRLPYGTVRNANANERTTPSRRRGERSIRQPTSLPT